VRSPRNHVAAHRGNWRRQGSGVSLLHSLSRRRARAGRVDCLALPENLAESLLFGLSAAPSPARRAADGRFRGARDGTSSSTRSATWSRVKASCCAYSKAAASAGWDRVVRFRYGPGWSPPPTGLVCAGAGGPLSPGSLPTARGLSHQHPALRERGDDILLLAEHFRVLHGERLNKPASI